MDNQQFAWILIAVSLLLMFAWVTYKVIINLHSRSWKSVFWGSWLLDPTQLTPVGQHYRRLYFGCLALLVVVASVLLGLTVF
jgi:hypothetical protein